MFKSPHKSIVVYGPQGSGKSEEICRRLCKHFQLDRVIQLDEHPRHKPLPKTGALVVSHIAPPEHVRRQMHFDQARKLLTTWPAGYPF